MGDKNHSVVSLGFFGLLAIAFMVLKLTKVIAWSWLWVLAPVWAPVALVVVLFCFGAALVWWSSGGEY
jgi:hypothetical protein